MSKFLTLIEGEDQEISNDILQFKFSNKPRDYFVDNFLKYYEQNCDNATIVQCFEDYLIINDYIRYTAIFNDIKTPNIEKFLNNCDLLFGTNYSSTCFYNGKYLTIIRCDSKNSWRLEIAIFSHNNSPSKFTELSELKKEINILLYEQLSNEKFCKIKYLTASQFGTELTQTTISVPSVDLDLNYGASFKQEHEKLVQELSLDKSGIFILRGEAGTGKSTYIAYLSKCLDKPIIYITEQFSGNLSDPSLINILIKESGAILVIEDAERAIAPRDGGYSSVATLLNLGDGLLGSITKFKIILSFNTNQENIDNALLRPGRCRANIEFKKLSKEGAKKLAESLGKDASKIDKDMSLAEVYNLEAPNFIPAKITKKPIGFT